MSKEIIEDKPLTKKVVLDCLMRIKLDHSIAITEQELDLKVNLTYEDCKDMSAELFIECCEAAREKNLYNKLPSSSEIRKARGEEVEYYDSILRRYSQYGR